MMMNMKGITGREVLPLLNMFEYIQMCCMLYAAVRWKWGKNLWEMFLQFYSCDCILIKAILCKSSAVFIVLYVVGVSWRNCEKIGIWTKNGVINNTCIRTWHGFGTLLNCGCKTQYTTWNITVDSWFQGPCSVGSEYHIFRTLYTNQWSLRIQFCWSIWSLKIKFKKKIVFFCDKFTIVTSWLQLLYAVCPSKFIQLVLFFNLIHTWSVEWQKYFQISPQIVVVVRRFYVYVYVSSYLPE